MKIVSLVKRLNNVIMEVTKLIDRIEINPRILNGKPVIRGTRLSVQFIMGLMAQGMTVQDILNEYHRLTEEDIHACFEFAAQALESSLFYPLSATA